MSIPLFCSAESPEQLEGVVRDAGFANLEELLDAFEAETYSDDPMEINPWRPVGDAEALGLSETDFADFQAPGVRVRFAAQLDKIQQNISLLRAGWVSSDLRIGPTGHITDSQQHWCGRSFENRDAVRRRIGGAALAAAGLSGSSVNVFIVDNGLHRDTVNAIGRRAGASTDSFAGGLWTGEGRPPGEFEDPQVRNIASHGHMIVRNVLSLAPDAKIWDIPIVPRRITNLTAFLSDVFLLYAALLALRLLVSPERSWCISNAWAIFDRKTEFPRGDYTERAGHDVNLLARGLVDLGVDVIFGAGNSGQFCPSTRSSYYDRGSGRSIWFANGLPDVMCVGATRADNIWVGTSSQGPAPSPEGELNEKPDFCVPSWFSETHDRAVTNTGTSASCALAVGATAALRERWNPTTVPPRDMVAALRDSATRVLQRDWNARYGEGVLNLAEALGHLPVLGPDEPDVE